MRWSKLPPERLEIELARLGLTVDDLVSDAQDVPEVKPWFERLASEDARRAAAVELFGDQGHPQPAERSEWYITGRTPDWGRLPRLEDGEPSQAAAPDDNVEHDGACLVSRPLVRSALTELRDRERGRRKLAEDVPGLTEHQARWVLFWWRVGKPAGLWLDEQDREKWGRAISPTHSGLLLPRG